MSHQDYKEDKLKDIHLLQIKIGGTQHLTSFS
jgi:hypothetical protein